MNIEFTLQRDDLQETRTFGQFMVDGKPYVQTLEDAVREVAGQPVKVWKIKKETAIPTGRYRVTLENSSNFGPETLTINGVEGFEYIRMHGGNTERDTEGCPLLGMNRTDTGINTCARAVDLVKQLVRKANAAGDTCWLTVRNPD